MTNVKVVVEGVIDYAVAQRLLAGLGASASLAAAYRGREPILSKLRGYDIASRHEPWFVLFDLDDGECAPSVLSEWLPETTGQIVVRVAVREVEAWLLADTEFARTLRVPANSLPRMPDEVPMPKRMVVDIVRAHCLTNRIRAAVLPDQSSRAIGVGYSDLIIDFVRHRWDPERAAERSDSLRRCLAALEELTA